ncbi:N-acyl-D-amino-acid deacylase family protein [Gemmatimonas phototrophica]|uniref:PI-PLC Y-box domain-containing protein n=1 Tax=Gemmatimonas phototrophica TaxID=1379270 RepID=A0A143BJW9_9BACT|nr:amidohydrolase family protein [Gemmatimonas phototrophica]AMW05329.1 hypothetical protein GEMMAAP_12000 [Gemmatimonas phototrophica]
MAAAIASTSVPLAAQSFDVVLKGGTIIDGTGAPAQRLDVALQNGRIVAVAPSIRSTGVPVVDATGLVVAPGFIDPHAHISTIAQQPDAENFLRQGITTIFNSLHSLDQPYPLGAFLDTLRVAPNTMWTAGHTWARKRVMGTQNRAATAAELDSMRGLVARAMDDGAFGLGTGLEYIPAIYAPPEEIVALAQTARRRGSLYVTHLRDEGAALEYALAEAMDVGRRSGQPVHVSHLKSTGKANWGKSTAVLAGFDTLNARGMRVSFDVYPYAAYSTYSDVLFPGWVLADNQDSVTARLGNPRLMERIRREMRSIFEAQTGGTAASVRFRTLPSAPQFVGKTLADYLAAKGLPLSLDAAIDALIAMQRAGGFTATVEAMSEQDIEAFLRHDVAMVSTDGDLVTPGKGFPHPRSYGAFPRVLAHYVGQRRLMPLEAAIAKMTSVPARTLGLTDRGVIRPGAIADLVLFTPATFADKATFTDPHHYAEGVVHLFINGQAVIRDGQLTGARPGRPIRRAP